MRLNIATLCESAVLRGNTLDIFGIISILLCESAPCVAGGAAFSPKCLLFWSGVDRSLAPELMMFGPSGFLKSFVIPNAPFQSTDAVVQIMDFRGVELPELGLYRGVIRESNTSYGEFSFELRSVVRAGGKVYA